jgi:hypothetical protein
VLVVAAAALRTCLVAADSSATAESDPVEATVQSQASVGATQPEPEGKSQAASPHEEWKRAQAGGRLSVYKNKDGNALIGSIEDGASVLVIHTSEPCWGGGTWTRVLLPTTLTAQEPTEGLSCTITRKNKVKTHKEKTDGKPICEQE